MSTKDPKSILKDPKNYLYEDMNGHKTDNKAEKLFDEVFCLKRNNVNIQTYNRNKTTNRSPLKIINRKQCPERQQLNDSESGDENDVTVVDRNDTNFEPKFKSLKNKKIYNRVKFNELFDENVKQRKESKKRKTKKCDDYPDCTKEALLKAFEAANLPDYEEIARFDLMVTPVNGNTTVANPPTPPLHQVLKPFEDLIDWGQIDLEDDKMPNIIPSKLLKIKNKSCDKPLIDITEESISDVSSGADFSCKNSIPNHTNDCSTNTTLENIAKPENNDKSLSNDRSERLYTAGTGASRTASTPVSNRFNISIDSRSRLLSPIASVESPDGYSNKKQNTFIKPIVPYNRMSRRRPKSSVTEQSVRLEIIEPSEDDIEKVTLRTSRARDVSKSLSEANNCHECDDTAQYQMTEEFETLTNAYKPESSVSIYDLTLVSEEDTNLQKNAVNNRTKELSSIFAPKIKSTPLTANQQNSLKHNKRLINSKFDLFVDKSSYDCSMSKLFLSKSHSNISVRPIITTTIVPVYDTERKISKSRKKSNAYCFYRKSIASFNSINNKSCAPFRSIVQTKANNSVLEKIGSNLKNKDLKQCLDKSLSVVFSKSKLVFQNGREQVLSSKQKVLSLCEPGFLVDFSQVFSENILEKCKKIGEGSYGEVYVSKDLSGKDFIIKIIPLNMDNEEEDIFAQILPELVISQTFNQLKNNGTNKTMNFIQMIQSSCCQGLFPKKLLEEWYDFANRKESENEDPINYDENQIYIILQLSNGGTDLESYKFKNSVQAFSMFQQLSLSLAAAELEYEFEHRDLHWGNVLIGHTDESHLEYLVNGSKYTVESNNIFVSIIDFSLSRMSKDGYIIFDDLNKYPELFEGQNEYQFDIYRIMRENNQNDWQKFSPKSNIFWLHYLLDKLIKEKKYSNFRTKIHKQCINILKQIYETVRKFKSCVDLVESDFFADIQSQVEHELK